MLQVTENPIYMHCTKSDTTSLKACVDSAAAVGFEMVIISFGAVCTTMIWMIVYTCTALID